MKRMYLKKKEYLEGTLIFLGNQLGDKNQEKAIHFYSHWMINLDLSNLDAAKNQKKFFITNLG